MKMIISSNYFQNGGRLLFTMMLKIRSNNTIIVVRHRLVFQAVLLHISGY